MTRLSHLALAACFAASPFVSTPASAAPTAQTQAVSQARPDSLPTTPTAAESYAARERAATDLEAFQGGAVLVITATAVAIVLAIILLIVLI